MRCQQQFTHGLRALQISVDDLLSQWHRQEMDTSEETGCGDESKHHVLEREDTLSPKQEFPLEDEVEHCSSCGRELRGGGAWRVSLSVETSGAGTESGDGVGTTVLPCCSRECSRRQLAGIKQFVEQLAENATLVRRFGALIERRVAFRRGALRRAEEQQAARERKREERCRKQEQREREREEREREERERLRAEAGAGRRGKLPRDLTEEQIAEAAARDARRRELTEERERRRAGERERAEERRKKISRSRRSRAARRREAERRRADRSARLASVVAMSQEGRRARDIATALGLSSTRVYQILASARRSSGASPGTESSGGEGQTGS